MNTESRNAVTSARRWLTMQGSDTSEIDRLAETLPRLTADERLSHTLAGEDKPGYNGHYD